MHISEIRARNFKALHDVTIRAAGKRVVIIGGRNAQGKSSVLDAVVATLAGKRAVPAEPVRRGEDEGEVTVEVGDFTVRRTFKTDGSTKVTIRAKDGGKYGQARLDQLFSDLGPDPVAFINAKEDRQIEIAKEALGLDLSDLDNSHARHFERRTEINREVARCAAELQGVTFHNDAPEQVVSVADLLARVEHVDKQIHEKTRLERMAEHHRENQIRLCSDLNGVRDQIAALEARARTLADAADAEFDRYVEFAEEANQIVPDEDTQDLRRQIAEAEAINAKVRENERVMALRRKHTDAIIAAQHETELLQDIAEARRKRIAEAEFPVDGLELTEGGILLNGLPFAQASSAERLRVAVAMGLAMNPELRVFMVRDGSLLDADSLALFDKMAEEYDAQFWIERVGDADAGAVVIEDGEVRA